MKVAVLIPCYNEELSIAKVVQDFRAALPEAVLYVYDNNSRDRTAAFAAQAGARVHREPLQGKGNVVRRMFGDIEADIYVMVDGDATYDASSAPMMIRKLVDENLDMVVGTRLKSQEQGAFREGHHVGNRLLTGCVAMLFGNRFKDMLSGYRVMSRRFVKSFPAQSTRFEIETELAVHSLALRLPVAEVETPYFARPEGSFSKLDTWRDGVRILRTVFDLLKGERPLLFFSAICLTLVIVATIIAIPIVVSYAETGLVPRYPTVILATGITILAAVSLTSGLVLDHVKHSRRELKRLIYLQYKAPAAE